MARDPIKNLQWNKGGRAPTDNKIGYPAPNSGSDGDVQIKQTTLGARLFGKIGGRWYQTPLAVDDKVRFGTAQADQLVISNDAVSIFKDNSTLASFGAITTIGDTTTEHIKLTNSSMDMLDGSTTMMSLAAGSISMTGKIIITSTGTQNVCIGDSNINDAGNNNIVLGVGAGGALTSNNDDHILIGTDAGKLVDGVADANICMGNRAGDAMTAAYNNILIGRDAGGAMTGNYNYQNIAIGNSAMANGNSTDASNRCISNVAIGLSAASTITTGSANTVVGLSAGAVTTGSGNVCIGRQAGQISNSIDSGDNNVMVGDLARASASDVDSEIVIGASATGQGTNYAVIGNSNVTRLYAADDGAAVLYANATIVSSDERMKENIEDINIGLDFINKLTPITYTRKQPADYEQSLKENLSWYGKKDPRVIEDAQKTKIRPGFLAQDIEDVLKELNFSENNSMVQVDDVTTQYSMDYASIVVPLTKAVQELSAKLDTMQTEINKLKEG